MIEKIWKFLTSLRLTVVLLAFGVLLVWVGTVAQADEGLYQAQARYFKHWFVPNITLFGHRLPVPLPGGYLIGSVLLVNLTAAFIKRFQWTTKKIGIHLTHIGIILLLVGQLATDLFSRETQMRVLEGESKSYSESGSDFELAFLSDADADTQNVVAIPLELVTPGAELRPPQLPFAIRVKKVWPNSTLSFRAPMQQEKLPPPMLTNGVALSFDFQETKVTQTMNDKNVPAAFIEIATDSGSLGEWIAPGWCGDAVMYDAVAASYRRQMGPQLAASIKSRLTAPQTVTVGGKKYSFVMRPVRAYKPYSLTLLKATHSKYPGTDIPKDFRSRVRIDNPKSGEKREVEIYMNNPLRYAGLTFFQFQMDADDMRRSADDPPSSTFQVVRNPSWITPYAGCVIVAAGMIIQFMIHLVGFVSRRKTA